MSMKLYTHICSSKLKTSQITPPLQQRSEAGTTKYCARTTFFSQWSNVFSNEKDVDSVGYLSVHMRTPLLYMLAHFWSLSLRSIRLKRTVLLHTPVLILRTCKTTSWCSLRHTRCRWTTLDVLLAQIFRQKVMYDITATNVAHASCCYVWTQPLVFVDVCEQNHLFLILIHHIRILHGRRIGRNLTIH